MVGNGTCVDFGDIASKCVVVSCSKVFKIGAQRPPALSKPSRVPPIPANRSTKSKAPRGVDLAIRASSLEAALPEMDPLGDSHLATVR